MDRRNLTIIALVVSAIAVGAVEVHLNSIGEFLTERTQTVWGFAFIMLSIMWANEDAKNQRYSKPFSFGLLMYIFWPVAFPYYLLTTRRIKGLIYILGFLAIWSGPWLAGLISYVYIYE